MNIMNKVIVILIVLSVLFGCKSTEIVNPANVMSNNTDLSYSSDILTESNQLVHAFAKLCENDSIRTEIIMIAGRGMEGYYWVPLQKLVKNLYDKYGIVLSERVNSFITNYYGLNNNTDYYSNYINNAYNKGYAPHILIPNLKKFVESVDQEDVNGLLDITYSEAKQIPIQNFVDYQLYDNEVNYYMATRFTSGNFSTSTITKLTPCESPVMFLSYRIANMIDFSPCDGLNNKVVYNCIFHEFLCKICLETQPHNNVVNTISNSAPVGDVEMRINQNVLFDQSCYNDKIYHSSITLSEESFGFLATIPNLDYYHALDGTVQSGFKNKKNRITKYPIKYYSEWTSKFYDVNQASLCVKQNDFRSLEHSLSENALGGGIYKLSRLNGLPYYFVWPGQINGSMMFVSGADGVVEYNIHGDISQKCNNPDVRSVQEELNVSTLCRFCGPTNNSLGIELEDVASNNLDDLVDFWYADALSVGIIIEATDSPTPTQNIITFQGGLTSNSTCSSPPSNKTLIVELSKSGDVFDQLKYFTINNNLSFYDAGTSFYIEVDVTFADGKFINSCGTITAATNSSNGQLKAAAIFPRGNLATMSIKVYKIN